MNKMKKPKIAAKIDDDGADQPPPARKTTVITAAIATSIFAAAGSATYFFGPMLFEQKPTGDISAPHIRPTGEAKGKPKDHESDKGNPKKKPIAHGKNGSGVDDEGEAREADATFVVRGEIGVFIPRPVIISLKPQGRIRYLKVGLAIETTPESEDAFIDAELRIIDILTSYLRAVEVAALEDPVAMARIREQIAHRVRFVIDPAPVNAVLITDFILS